MNRIKYTCAACDDPKQGEVVPASPDYVAINNVPKYWALCEKHYLRLQPDERENYAPVVHPC